MLKHPDIHSDWSDYPVPSVAAEVFSSGWTYASSGERIKASSHVAEEEGIALARLILRNPSIKQTLEVGCAQGVSSLFICDALQHRPGSRHTIIDPFQQTDWRGAGLAALKRAGLSNFDFLVERSEFALPRLHEEGRKFDLMFIDGLHTFDHALVDCFYATKMLNVGGFLMLDDTEMPPIDKLQAYLRNYPCFQIHEAVYAHSAHPWKRLASRIGGLVPLSANLRHHIPRKYRGLFRKPRMIAFRKVREDQRKWNWYRPF